MQGTHKIHKISAIINTKLQLQLTSNVLRKSDNTILIDRFPSENFQWPVQLIPSGLNQPIDGVLAGGALTVTEALGQHGMIPLLSDD